jgi:DNA-binding NarL/FixJ family response regulator
MRRDVRRLRTKAEMPTVFVISQDWQLRIGVRAELRERGVEALGMEQMDVAAQHVAGRHLPSAVVLDVGEGRPADFVASAAASLARIAPLVLIASQTVACPNVNGAACVLSRPLRLQEIVSAVEKVLQGQAA